MKTRIEYPLCFMAKPPKSRLRLPVATAYALDWDIPEISRGEADLVFSSTTAFDDKERPITSLTDVFSFEGRLFRRISKAGAYDHLLSRPYGHSWAEAEGWFDSISKPYPPLAVNPVTNLVQGQIGWQLAAADRQGIKARVYPPAYPNGAHWSHTDLLARNSYPEVVATVSDIDREALELGLTRIERQAAKLMLIDGQLWIETPPPAILVSVGDRPKTVAKTLAFVPEIPMPLIDVVFFPLDRADEADEFAHGLAHGQGSTGTWSVSDLTVPYEADDSDDFWFDHGHLETRNLALNLALATHPTVRLYASSPRMPDYIGRILGGAEHATHNAAMEIVRNADFVMGECGDIAPMIDNIIKMWNGCRNPTGHLMTGELSASAERFLLSHAAERADHAPISLPIALNRP